MPSQKILKQKISFSTRVPRDLFATAAQGTLADNALPNSYIGIPILCDKCPMASATWSNYGAVIVAKSSNQYVSFSCRIPATGTYTLNISYFYGTLPTDASKNWQLRYGDASTDDDAVPSTSDVTLANVKPSAINRRKLATKTGMSLTVNKNFVGYWYPNSNQHDQDCIIETVWIVRTA